MVTYIAGTDGTRTSAVLCDYLEDEVAGDDTVHAVHALGDAPSYEATERGTEALAVFTDRLGKSTDVELHSPVRSTPPSEELLITANEVDADRIVIGLRQHGVTERVIFGSTAQDVLKNASRPVIAVPLDAE